MKGSRSMAVAAAVVLAASAEGAEGQFSGFSTKGNLSVWRVNHGNGAVSLCSFEGQANEPVCYPWSAGGNPGVFTIIPGDDVLSTWRMNASSGAVSLCEYEELSDPPTCTPWSDE